LRPPLAAAATVDDTSEVQRLRRAVAAEGRLAEAADVAAKLAMLSAKREAAARKLAETELEESEQQIREAKETVAGAQPKIASLEDRLADAGRRVAVALATKTLAKEREANATRAAARLNPPKTPDHLFALAQWLRSYPHQHVIAAVAGLSGVASIVRPPLFFEAVTVAIFSVAVGMFAVAEFSDHLGGTLPHWLGFLLGAEVAAVVALACHKGFQGFQLLVGVLLGACCVYLCKVWIPLKSSGLGMDSLSYTVCCTLGVIAMFVGQQNACAVFGPVIGGFMAKTCFGFFATTYFLHNGAMHTWFDEVDRTFGGVGALDAFTTGEKIVHHAGVCIWVVVAGLGIGCWFLEVRWPRRDAAEEARDFRRPLLSVAPNPPPPPAWKRPTPPKRPSSSIPEPPKSRKPANGRYGY